MNAFDWIKKPATGGVPKNDMKDVWNDMQFNGLDILRRGAPAGPRLEPELRNPRRHEQPPATRGKIRIVPATIAHAEAMVGRLRPGDAAEIEAAGMEERQALVDSVADSVEAWAALEGDTVLAAWGISASALLGNDGWPWLLTTVDVDRHKIRLVREARRFIERARGMYPHLQMWVDARYVGALRLVASLGFRVHPPAPWKTDAPFCRVELGE